MQLFGKLKTKTPPLTKNVKDGAPTHSCVTFWIKKNSGFFQTDYGTIVTASRIIPKFALPGSMESTCNSIGPAAVAGTLA